MTNHTIVNNTGADITLFIPALHEFAKNINESQNLPEEFEDILQVKIIHVNGQLRLLVDFAEE